MSVGTRNSEVRVRNWVL